MYERTTATKGAADVSSHGLRLKIFTHRFYPNEHWLMLTELIGELWSESVEVNRTKGYCLYLSSWAQARSNGVGSRLIPSDLIQPSSAILGDNFHGQTERYIFVSKNVIPITQSTDFTLMHWMNYVVVWTAFGLINYAIKITRYKEDWKKEGNRVFFIAVLMAAIAFGPIGLLLTLLNTKGKPFWIAAGQFRGGPCLILKAIIVKALYP